MVARGDLGSRCRWSVPRVQKDPAQARPAVSGDRGRAGARIDAHRAAATRAEARDAGGAVDGGADAIMLSGETATGFYPVRSVQVLDAIIRDAETIPPPSDRRRSGDGLVDHAAALCEASVSLSSRSGAQAIVAVTREGNTAALLSAIRPRADILAATDSEEVARRVNLCRRDSNRHA